MRIRLVAGLLALTVAGCAGSGTTPHDTTRPGTDVRATARPLTPHVGTAPPGTTYPETTYPEIPHLGTAYVERGAPARGPSSGDWAVSIVGTPFLLVFRSVVCASSVVVAAPFSAIFALANAPDGLELLGDGVTQNCAGPYILRPSDVS
jgi:hypothetical protein